MFHRRRLIPLTIAAGAGLGSGAAAWLVWAVAVAPNPAGELNARTAALSAPPAPGRGPTQTVDILSMVLFADVQTAPQPVESEAPSQVLTRSLRLHGISITPRRRAALISAAAGPAMWIPEGQEVGGMVLRRVRRDGVLVEVAGAGRSLDLHQAPATLETDPPLVQTVVPSPAAATVEGAN